MHAVRLDQSLTSEARTQLTGPKLRENIILVRNIMAIPTLCAVRFADSPGGKHATMALKIENVITKDPAPNARGFFRPTRSMRNVMKL